VALGILQYTSGAQMDAVAGQVIVQGRQHILASLNGQQS